MSTQLAHVYLRFFAAPFRRLVGPFVRLTDSQGNSQISTKKNKRLTYQLNIVVYHSGREYVWVTKALHMLKVELNIYTRNFELNIPFKLFDMPLISPSAKGPENAFKHENRRTIHRNLPFEVLGIFQTNWRRTQTLSKYKFSASAFQYLSNGVRVCVRDLQSIRDHPNESAIKYTTFLI